MNVQYGAENHRPVSAAAEDTRRCVARSVLRHWTTGTQRNLYLYTAELDTYAKGISISIPLSLIRMLEEDSAQVSGVFRNRPSLTVAVDCYW